MKSKLLLLICILFSLSAFSRTDVFVANPYQVYFDQAYQLNPEVPRGLLEAVAFTNTRFNHIIHVDGEEGSCIGMPAAYGVMGLILDGKNYFRNNLQLISQLSGYSTEEIISNPEKNILAYAKAFKMQQALNLAKHIPMSPLEITGWTLKDLSELPFETQAQQFAFNAQLYGIFSFMNNAENQTLYHFPHPHIDMENYFLDNYNILSATSVSISSAEIKDGNGNVFRTGHNNPNIQSPDYAPAIWDQAPSCNFSSRNTAISAVTIHDVEGSYAGCISWFNNCAAGVSAHYVVRSSDGQITQMVYEADKAWHVGSENPYTIGIEHEGYASQTGWYTNAMYNATANLCIDIAGSGYGIDPNRTAWWPWANTTYYNQSSIPGSCAKIKGHQHYPNQSHTDPGPNWDWNYFYMLINAPPAATTYATATGTIYDSGGAAGNYADDERTIWTISPAAATSVTLTFNSFSVENSWDYLYIYDGNSVNAPRIGYYTGTNSPGTIISSGGSLTLEFRSDCATTGAGWNASWSSNSNVIVPANLSVTSAACPDIGATLNWTNTGAGWFIDVSTDPSFATFYNKDVSNLTSVACPGGFCEYPSCASYLKFRPNTTYYWRIWDGTSQTYGSSFTTPDCRYADFNCSGTFDDTGGPSGNYSGNEDYIFMITPPNATSVTVNFSTFDLEANFDSLFIYDGPSVSAPLVGVYTGTNSPGTITSTDTALTFRFISDPFVNTTGFTSSWTCTQLTTGIPENQNGFSLAISPNPFADNLQLNYSLEEKSNVEISLIDVLGRRIILSANEIQAAGKHEQDFDLASHVLAKGIYFLELNVGGERLVVKIVRE
ncbi:MAG: N-acetylmuramoyl-L-alanine amidase [Bacteroidota bacterium]|nr:N-acetylmuramoyl-L-alanine amidase [Bacteroidota bacterium]